MADKPDKPIRISVDANPRNRNWLSRPPLIPKPKKQP